MSPMRRVRFCTWFLIAGLTVSGLTAIPIQMQLSAARSVLGADWRAGGLLPAPATEWFRTLDAGITATANQAPFMFYGTDWLAFGHLMIALAFVGAVGDPVRNRWLYQFGMLASALVPIWAIVFGQIRGIPWWWRVVDASFGVGAFIPSWLAWRWTGQLQRQSTSGRTRG